MINFLILVAIGILFYLLSKSADLVVDSIKKIGYTFHIPILFLGFILGFFASLPELSIAVNTSVRDIGDLSLGNLLGGMSVLFGLILGVSIFLSRPISTDGKYTTILPILGYSFLPFLFGLNGEISFFEGTFLIVSYVILIIFLFKETKHIEQKEVYIQHSAPKKQVVFIVVGIVSLLVVSNIIIRLTETILESYNVPAFFIGFLLFSIGTNLPEIAISFRSIRKHVAELSLASIFGSVIANSLIAGILSIIRPVPIEHISSYIVLTVSTGILLFFVLRFYKTEKKFSKKEGVILALLYGGIVLLQIIFV
ncbi:sodium:calcium antiporter [Candidatus Parcubacteria bacterium]|jgi:cation:H+ antiporter|nr:MAG: sodium:calcium antiporter [Candidatus Parcubacteria bacterium]